VELNNSKEIQYFKDETGLVRLCERINFATLTDRLVTPTY
jgi:hypothetical protein